MSEHDWDAHELRLDSERGSLVSTGVGPLDHLLAAIRPENLERVSNAVEAGYGFGFDEVGFSFPDDLDEDGEPGEDVEIYDPFDKVSLAPETFRRLMRRALRLLAADRSGE